MSLDNLPTHELAQAARAEAAAFALPKNWRTDRKSSHGFAIDEPHSPDIDDAVSLSRLGDTHMLHVSTADVGSFLVDQVAVARYARRRAWSLYKGKRIVAPMIPRDISEDKLSLLDGVERPAVTVHVPIDSSGNTGLPKITRDVIRARRIAYAEVEDLVDEEGYESVALRGLERIACLLFSARHNGEVSPEDATIEDEEGNLLDDSQEYDTGQLIVQESMIAANTAMARFMQEHDIPALYRNHVVPPELLPEIADPLERSQLLGSLARATYDPSPRGHVALNLATYTHFTSPLRRFPDFANHANLIAFLEGREYPYPVDRLGRIAERLQTLALKEAGMSSEANPRAPRPKRTEQIISPYRKALHLLNRFADGTAGPGELATALFNAVGTAEEIGMVGHAAAQFAANHIHHARPALNVALDRKLISLRPAREEDNIRGAKLILEDRIGNAYPLSAL